MKKYIEKKGYKNFLCRNGQETIREACLVRQVCLAYEFGCVWCERYELSGDEERSKQYKDIKKKIIGLISN